MSITATTLGWLKSTFMKVAPKAAPDLLGWWFRRRYSVGECRRQLQAALGHNLRFELWPSRPSAGLGGISIEWQNHLPFPVQLSLHRIQIQIDSTIFHEAGLNAECAVSDHGSLHQDLGELQLTEQQVNWLRQRRNPCERVKVTVSVRASCSVRPWEQDLHFSGLAELCGVGSK